MNKFELRLKYKSETSRAVDTGRSWIKDEDGHKEHVLDYPDSVLDYVEWLEEKLMSLL